ncbi:Thg1-domain-containing protein [Periconia macrospinosa]|uniref:tRNA(His) guanylyltransferase n=1 Tax=Periconia macrospinosa TaxID=97972 RepID=A0A2V1D8A1_9PLEO|nr:Thg1-domain-containing protein [Periconia macrospinosa]
MANSRFGYVRSFEQPDTLLPNTYVVVRIDGKGFTKLTAKYNFVKPNDTRGLGLMNAAAEAVMKELPDLVLAYGQSDEYSFVFPKDCQLFERRASKLTTLIVSVFTANYVFAWSSYFPDTPLTPPLPSFDGRAVCYPSELNLRDYLSWRQVDCHINNLFNTTFWALVQQGGMERRAAEQELSGTVAADKNEILFSRFGINYNNEPEIFKKGTVLYRDLSPASTLPPTTTPAKTVQSPLPPLSHPQPKKLLPRPMSQPLHSTYPSLFQDTPPPPMTSDPSTPRGPTFLSTSTTPSPPPPERDMSIPALPTSSPDKLSLAYPQTFYPVSPPSNGSASTMKSPFSSLTPIPLPPPILKPSTRPPPSLSPPNPTSHTNFSPLPSPNPDATYAPPPQKSSQSKNPVSHSASASLSRPTTGAPPSRPLPKRSPSMSILNFSPPQIPIRISSIPLDAPTRKLSLPSAKSYSAQRAEEKENTSPGRADKTRTPPLQTMKELPSPPADNDHNIRASVMGSEPQEWATSPTHLPFGSDRSALQDMISNSPPSEPPPRSAKRASSHSRLHSAPPSSSFFATTMAAAEAILSPPLTSRDANNTDWPPHVHSTTNSTSLSSPTSTPPVPSSSRNSQLHTTHHPRSDPPKGPQPPTTRRDRCSHTSTHHHIHHPQQRSSTTTIKKSGGKIKDHMEEDGGWLSGSAAAAGGDGRPVEKSKTQREKERKKKMKAKVVVEHVDIIKDGFWEKRPWILSGKVE